MAPLVGWPTSDARRSGDIGADSSNPLAMSHGRPIFLAVAQVPARHVETYSVPEDVTRYVLSPQVRAPRGESDDELHLVVQVVGGSRKVKRGRGVDRGVRR